MQLEYSVPAAHYDDQIFLSLNNKDNPAHHITPRKLSLAVNKQFKKSPQTNANKNTVKFVYYREETSRFSLLYAFCVVFCFMLYSNKTSLVPND